MKGLTLSLFCLAAVAAAQPKYSAWVNEDVTYIITDNERAAFLQLQSEADREKFVQDFWLRRDPTPDTIENEFREEHYRRIAYANEHFGTAVPGWKTDRGRVYIAYGPPDEIDEADTPTPRQIWTYRFIFEVGTNVMLDFVDHANSGDYQLTAKADKVFLPCSGLTILEQMGFSEKVQVNRANCTVPEVMAPAPALPALTPTPQAKFAELAAGADAKSAAVLPLKAEIDFFPLTKASTMTYVTLQFSNRDLGLKDTSAIVEVSGKVSTISGRTVEVFETEMRGDSGGREFQADWVERNSVAQTSFPLLPGTYRVTVVCKDAVSGRIGNWEQTINVPEVGLAASNLVLADFLGPLPRRGAPQPFAIGGTKVRPRVGGAFHRYESLGAYLELYNGPKAGRAKYEVLVPGWSSPILQTSDDLEDLPGASRAQTTLSKLLSLRELSSGSYTLRVTVYDADGGVSLRKEAAFAVN